MSPRLTAFFLELIAMVDEQVLTADDEPQNEKEEGWEGAGALDHELRRLYAKFSQSLSEAEQMAAELPALPPPEAQEQYMRFRRVRNIADILEAVFYHLTEEGFIPAEACGIEVCKGWEVAWTPLDDEESDEVVTPADTAASQPQHAEKNHPELTNELPKPGVTRH